MKLAFLIARRYLFSKKSTNAINIISMVSMIGMGIGAFALIVILSVYNGFEGLVMDLQNSFHPELAISPVEGKVFEKTDEIVNILEEEEDVAYFSFVLEENAYLRYKGKDVLAKVKGVDSDFYQVTDVGQYIVQGSAVLEEDNVDYLVLGVGLHFQLETNVNQPINAITVSIPKRGKVSAMVAAQLFNTGKVMPGGIFAIQNEFDNQYTIASLEFVQDVMGYKNEVSGIELKLIEGADEDVVKNNLQISLGDTFKIKTRYEQDEALYQIMQAERWAIVAILGLILLIISFNIVGSLSMLAMEKKRDVAILKAMGGEKSLIRNIFLLEGALGSLIGACVGLLLGIGLCYVQIITGFITLGMQGGFVVEAYPVIVEFRDIFLAFAMVFLISVVASWYPAIKASEQDTNFSE